MIKPAVILRASQLEDAFSIAELHNQKHFRWGTLRPPYLSQDTVKKWLETKPSEETHIVADVDGKVVGEALLSRLNDSRAHIGEISMLGVHDDFIGCGIGTTLMSALIDISDNWLNIMRLELTVLADNEKALALYKKFGFNTEGRLQKYGYRNGAYIDAFVMARLR